MASRPTEHAEEAHQASTELANPTGIRGNIEQASDTDTAMHPEHKTPAKEKAEKKGTSNSFLGRILGQAYTWLTSGRADQKNYNAKSSDATDKSPEDNDKARGCLFHVPADFRMDRHEHRSQNWLEDAEATIFRAYWAKRREVQAARAYRNKTDADKSAEELTKTEEQDYVDEEDIWDEELLQQVQAYYRDEVGLTHGPFAQWGRIGTGDYY